MSLRDGEREWSIRRARDDDAVAIVRVRQESIRRFGPAAYPDKLVDAWLANGADAERVRAAMQRDLQAFVAIGERGELLGFSQYWVREGRRRTGVYVAPAGSRRGIGSALLDAAIAAAIDDGAVEITIDASLNATGFYERHGFVRVADAEHVLRDGSTLPCVIMTKVLRTPCLQRVREDEAGKRNPMNRSDDDDGTGLDTARADLSNQTNSGGGTGMGSGSGEGAGAGTSAMANVPGTAGITTGNASSAGNIEDAGIDAGSIGAGGASTKPVP